MRLFPENSTKFIPGLVALALPVMFQNLLSTAVTVADNAMVGVLGEAPLSGVTVANQVFFVFMLFTIGAASAASVIISQYWGKGDRPTVRRLFWLSAAAALVIGLLFTVLSLACPEAVVGIYADDPELVAIAARYLRLVAPAHIPFALAFILMSALRGTEQVQIGMWLSAFSLVVNLFLNWVLIYGNLGMPALGVDGAAYATAAARIAQFVLLAVYFACSREKLMRFGEIRRISVPLTKAYLREMAPILVNECLWGLGTSMYMVPIGRMGTDAVSAYSMIAAFKDIMLIGGMGLGHGVSVMIGMAMGAGRRDEALTMAKLSIVLGVLCGVVFSAVSLLLFPVYMTFYNVSDQALEYGRIMNWIMSVHILISALNFICIVGILRGGGDGRTALLIDLMFLWPLCVPLSFLGGLVFGWPVYVVYGIIVLDEVLKFIFACRRVRSGKWMRNMTREFA